MLEIDLIPHVAHVLSVMLVPDDDRKRDGVEQSHLACLLAHALPAKMKLPADLVRWLYRAPKPLEAIGGPNKIRRILLHAKVIGWVAGFLVRAREHGYEDLGGVKTAIRAASWDLSLRHKRGVSFETLYTAWQRYACVSHLWAFAHQPIPTEEYNNGEWPPWFLSAAEQLRQRGEALIPRHASEPVLDPQKTWRVPAAYPLPSARVIWEPPTTEELALFDRLKKSNRC
jgi:hypothetical protein